ncbi:OST-HTH/LOTUS domain-containing protein [Amycolatopsis acidiphila]|nr:OST-HTH/LOTUS domain-containing protein [Amycolatopsis acidiphila]UIJ63964.1 OST-HTH/LOTUS domain-containing protein [Amycolatopsis acidiphila]
MSRVVLRSLLDRSVQCPRLLQRVLHLRRVAVFEGSSQCGLAVGGGGGLERGQVLRTRTHDELQVAASIGGRQVEARSRRAAQGIGLVALVAGIGWAALAAVGHIITQQRTDFDARNHDYAKLSELIAATTLFELDRRSPGDGKPAVIHALDKRHRPEKKAKATLPGPACGDRVRRSCRPKR